MKIPAECLSLIPLSHIKRKKFYLSFDFLFVIQNSSVVTISKKKKKRKIPECAFGKYQT